MSEKQADGGRRLMKHVCGFDVPMGMSRFSDITVEHLFGKVWADEALSIRDRRLIVLGILGAHGDRENMAIHMQQALSRGDLSAEELEEVVIQITHYAGWPCGTKALAAAGEAAAAHQGDSGESD